MEHFPTHYKLNCQPHFDPFSPWQLLSADQFADAGEVDWSEIPGCDCPDVIELPDAIAMFEHFVVGSPIPAGMREYVGQPVILTIEDTKMVYRVYPVGEEEDEEYVP